MKPYDIIMDIKLADSETSFGKILQLSCNGTHITTDIFRPNDMFSCINKTGMEVKNVIENIREFCNVVEKKYNETI